MVFVLFIKLNRVSKHLVIIVAAQLLYFFFHFPFLYDSVVTETKIAFPIRIWPTSHWIFTTFVSHSNPCFSWNFLLFIVTIVIENFFYIFTNFSWRQCNLSFGKSYLKTNNPDRKANRLFFLFFG